MANSNDEIRIDQIEQKQLKWLEEGLSMQRRILELWETNVFVSLDGKPETVEKEKVIAQALIATLTHHSDILKDRINSRAGELV
jgi:hypothetical protein